MGRIIDRTTSDGAEEQAKNVRPDQPENWKQEANRGKDMDRYLGEISPRKRKGK